VDTQTEDPPVPTDVESDPADTPVESETPSESETPLEDTPDPADVVVAAPTPEPEEPSIPVESDSETVPTEGEGEDNSPPVEPEKVPDPVVEEDPPAEDSPIEDPPAEDPPAEDTTADTETQPADGDEEPPLAVEDGEEAPPVEGEGEVPVDEAELTDDDLAATVAAIRADDEDLAEGGEAASLAPEPALTVFGCNVPTAGEEAVGAVVAGGDYLLAVAGLFGLIVARVRPKRRRKGE